MSFGAAIAGLWAGAALLFGLTFLVGRRLSNYGIVDVVWSLAFAPAAAVLAWLGTGGPRQWLFAGLMAFWSLRLGGHLAVRVLGHLDVEDSRYRRMRDDWAPRAEARMFTFYQQQAVSLVVLCLPLVAVAVDADRSVGPWHIAGALVLVAAVAGEALADAQLAAFKREQPGPGGICARGLWAFCRHPNYFCEWLVWVGFALMAVPSPLGGLFGVVCAGAMHHLLTRVTGVPLVEERMRRTRGAAWEAHCRRVPSAFWPRWPRAEKLRDDEASVQ